MGFRFRKSVNLGGARVNSSKSGVGYSVGGKGYRYTKKAGGGSRTTASIPGTGISYQKDSKKSSNKARVSAETASSTNYRFFWITFRFLSIPLVVLGALLALIGLAFGWVSMAMGIGLWLLANHYKKLHKKNKESA